MIDCDVGSDLDEYSAEADGRNQDIFSDARTPMRTSEDEDDEEDDSEERTDEEAEHDDEDGLMKVVNQAGADIKAAIKYNLIRNLYRSYLGVDVPYSQVMGRESDGHRLGFQNKQTSLKVKRFKKKVDQRLKLKVFEELRQLNRLKVHQISCNEQSQRRKHRSTILT